MICNAMVISVDYLLNNRTGLRDQYVNGQQFPSYPFHQASALPVHITENPVRQLTRCSSALGHMQGARTTFS